MKENSSSVKDDTNNIKSSMNDAITPINDINTQVNDFGGDTNDYIKLMKDNLGRIRLAFLIIFSLLMALIAASIVGVILAKILKTSCCVVFIHFGWCCTSWMMTLSLLLGVILFTAGIVMDDTCFSLSKIVTPTDLGSIEQI